MASPNPLPNTGDPHVEKCTDAIDRSIDAWLLHPESFYFSGPRRLILLSVWAFPALNIHAYGSIKSWCLLWSHPRNMQFFWSIFLASVSLPLRSVFAASCRNVPGDIGFPSNTQWAALNASVLGRLVPVVPSAQFCKSQPLGICTTLQWTSAVFRNEIPGAMNQVSGPFCLRRESWNSLL